MLLNSYIACYHDITQCYTGITRYITWYVDWLKGAEIDQGQLQVTLLLPRYNMLYNMLYYIPGYVT